MKKLYAVSLTLMMAASGAMGASNWVMMHPTVCKLDTTECYSTMGAGYERETWDATAQCWGQKLICPEALESGGSLPEPMTIDAIKKKTGISTDFDTDVLNGDCFGVRKTSANGSMASVGGQMVPVWCESVPVDATDYVANGVIAETQPTCTELADWGFIGIMENGCYGKTYDYDKYYIECTDDKIVPSRIIILNGAEYTTGKLSDTPIDAQAANNVFDTMQSVSETQRTKYFSNN